MVAAQPAPFVAQPAQFVAQPQPQVVTVQAPTPVVAAAAPATPALPSPTPVTVVVEERQQPAETNRDGLAAGKIKSSLVGRES